ncbi:MAG: hypothetical protein ACR2PL_10810 [Dehalococcoidia bacterium]
MDHFELILIGLLTGLCLVATDEACPASAGRFQASLKTVLLEIGVVLLAGVALWLLGLSITTNAVDFLEADLGILLGASIDHLPGLPPRRRRVRSPLAPHPMTFILRPAAPR